MSSAPEAPPSLEALVRRVVHGEPLGEAGMRAAMEHMLSGTATEVQMAAFLVALRMRGERMEEIAAAAQVLRERCLPVDLGLPEGAVVLDTCGTGGDGAGTFNVSTAAALVAAATGTHVAKHGNRAVSSQAGSADVLEALGIPLDGAPGRVAASVRAAGIGFFFAPQFHAAVRHVAPVRRALGIRTIFNVLGPLASPARATHQLLGVYDRGLVEPVARALAALGVRGAWVVRGEAGEDEVSLAGPTTVAVLRDGRVTTETVTPEAFGFARAPLDALRGGTAAENAGILRRILDGERSAYRDAVVLNAAAALMVVEPATPPKAAAAAAAEAIDSGRAAATLARWRVAMGTTG